MPHKTSFLFFYCAIDFLTLLYRTNTYGNILFVLTTSTISEDLYHFNTAQNGLLIGIP